MKSIKHLPRMVHASLRSSVYLSDLSRVVEELILNSIEACSTKIHISLSVTGFYVKVDDNGLGITREGLEFLGEEHATSKLGYMDDTYIGVESLNHIGETLGSLSDVSLLEVITKARGWPNGYRKVMKGWSRIFLGISDLRQDAGTTVIVRDLFYNQPVRRKHMQSRGSEKVLHSVKSCVIYTALAHPQVSFELVDLENDKLLLSTAPCKSPLPLIADAFGNDISDSLHAIDVSDGVYKLSGYLSRPADGSPAMVFQLLYINSMFISRSPIQKLIDNLASDHQLSLRDWKADQEFHNRKRSKIQGYASYMLKLFCPISTYDVAAEPSNRAVDFKNWSHLSTFIVQAVKNFWEQHPAEIPQGSICKESFASYKGSQGSLSLSPRTLSTDFVCKEECKVNTPSTWNDFWENDLTTPQYQSRHISLGVASDSMSDNILLFGDDYDVSDIRYHDDSTFNSNTPCQEKDAGFQSPFVLKRCKVLNILPDNSPQIDYCSTDTIEENLSFTGILGKRCRSNLDNELVHTKYLFETVVSPIESIERHNMLFDRYMSDGDDTSYFCPEEDLLQGSSRFNWFLSDTSPWNSICGDRSSHWQEKELLFGSMPNKSDLHSVVNHFLLDSENKDKGERFVSTSNPQLTMDHCHRVCKFVRKRSHSAPPFYRRKSKFSSMLSCPDKAFGRSTDLPSLRDDAIVEETESSKETFLQAYHSSTPHIQYPHKCIQHYPSNHNEKVHLACEMNEQHADNNVAHQRFCYSDVKGPVTQEIGLPTRTTRWRNQILSQPLVDRGQKFSSGCDEILNILSGILNLAGSFLQPESISRDSLQDAKVLLQLDRKFIPIMAGGTLAIIDQHAADERIRLEELRRKVLSGGGNSVTYLKSEQELFLPEIGCQLLQSYAEQVQKWGWICNIHTQHAESFSKNLNVLKRRTCRVTLKAVPCILGINLTDNDLMEFLEQLAATDGSAVVPPSIHRLLNSKACRGAIMFGDTLLPSECSLIVEELKKTSLCFQCAHGRPTTVPLVNIVELHKQLNILQLQTGDLMDCWHGLRRHRPSLERTQQRLEASMKFSH